MTERVHRLRTAMEGANLDGLLVTQPENRRYISGFTGTSGMALITLRQSSFITDFRYLDQAAAQCVGFQIRDQGQDWLAVLKDVLQEDGVQTLGFDPHDVTYALYEQLSGLCNQIPGLRLQPAPGLVEKLRLVKEPAEVARIERAAAIADAAFAHVLGIMRPGMTEREVAWELESFMRSQGASGPSFDTIVASGWRSSLPHGVASDKELAAGEFVTLDFGAVYEGYCSDITRTVVLGRPTDEQKRIYGIVLEAQQRALEAMQAGMTGAQMDALARDVISKAGYAEAFGHSLGHGIGLAIHEEPRLSQKNTEPVPAGAVVTVEPGIYLSKWGGVRIEDDVLLLEGGGIRLLTHSDKQLICL